MEKNPKLHDLFFSSPFTAWRIPLLVNLLPFKLISLLQKGLNIRTYLKKCIASDKSILLPVFCLKVNRINHFIHRNELICFIVDSYHADPFHNLLLCLSAMSFYWLKTDVWRNFCSLLEYFLPQQDLNPLV